VDLDSTLKPDKPTVAIQMRRDAAADLGLNVNAVASALRTLVAGQTVGNWRAADGETYDVRVRLAPERATTAATCSNLPLIVTAAADGSPRVVRLQQVADVQPSTGPNQINRRDLTREINVDANTLGRSAGDVSADIRRVLDSVPGRRATATASAARPRTCRTASAMHWRRWRWRWSSST
jgi:HAE1 family hydrophobic/amphiphilic exporter-1